MEEKKRFLRFVVDLASGKILATNIITKIFEDGIFKQMDGGYIFAKEGQIEIDVENRQMIDYSPLSHFKHLDGKIIKKSDEEILVFEDEYKKKREEIDAIIRERGLKIGAAQDIIQNPNLAMQEKLPAMIELLKNLK